VIFLFSTYTGHSSEKLIYATDTQYSHLKVMDLDDGMTQERVLIMDGLIHNRYDLEQPDNLLYEYERMFASLTRDFLRSRSQAEFSTLTLGGGACVFPTFLVRRYPESLNEVVEIDPEVVKIAYKYFDALDDLRVIEADGRNYVNFMKGKRTYDLIFLDAFNSFSVPHHLTTREFTETVSDLLKPGGLVMANCIDILSVGKFLTAYMNTLASVFSDVSVYVSTENEPHTRSTFILAASNTPIGSVVLRDERGVVYARKMTEAQEKDLIARNGTGHLTDDYAPVENFIAPIYLMSLD
jgi:spermidine synthase